MSIGVTIASSSVGKYVYPGSVQWSKTLGERGSGSCVLKTLDGYAPDIGQDVGFWDGATKVFGGSIEQAIAQPIDQPGAMKYSLTISSHERRADKRRIEARAYVGQTAGDIVLDILGRELLGELLPGAIQTGATVDKIVFDHVTVAEALTQLATLSNFVWSVDPDLYLSFGARATSPIAYTLRNHDVLWLNGGPTYTRNRQDYRNVEHLRINWTAFSDASESFLCDGSAIEFTLARPVSEIVSITLYDGVYATVAGTFSGLPADGDTATINGVAYTFKSALAQTTPRQVLIGADEAACALALASAVNRADAGYGTLYSSATSAHPNCRATQPIGTTVAAYFATAGIGDGAPVAAIGTAFAWAASTMTGSGSGTTTSQTFGESGSDSQWYWATGEASITQAPSSPATPIPLTSLLVVVYRALGADVITIRDWTAIAARASAEGGTGIYETVAEDTGIVDGNVGLAKCQAILNAYKAIPQIYEYDTLKYDLTPGEVIAVDVTHPTVSGLFLVDSIAGRYVPDTDHFRYRVRLIDGTRIATWLQFWESLGKSVSNTVISGGAGGSAGFITPSRA